MKRALIFAFLFSSIVCFANRKDSTISYTLPDSVKAISFLAEITVTEVSKNCVAGIKTDAVTISFEKHDYGSSIWFYSNNYRSTATIERGIGVFQDLKYEHPKFGYDWKKNEPYKLLISQATDSAGNFSLYSSYLFLPEEGKWKLIGALKIKGRWNTIQQPAIFYRSRKKQPVSISTTQVWCQRQNGSWKNMLQKNLTPPVVNLLSHVDSLEQLQIDKKLITQAIAENKIDAKNDHDGIYYTILKEGTGRQVSVNDTVTVFYKGYLFSDNSVFDETKDNPATFPLKRLIMGWQLGVPLCKVGGKIKIIIPSN